MSRTRARLAFWVAVAVAGALTTAGHMQSASAASVVNGANLIPYADAPSVGKGVTFRTFSATSGVLSVSWGTVAPQAGAKQATMDVCLRTSTQRPFPMRPSVLSSSC